MATEVGDLRDHCDASSLQPSQSGMASFVSPQVATHSFAHHTLLVKKNSERKLPGLGK